MKNFFLAALVCVVLVSTQSDLSAQITWSPAVQLIAGGDNTDFVSQNGTFVLGVNPGGVDTTVGTAVFTNAGGLVNANTLRASGGVTSTQNGVTFTGDFDNVQQASTFQFGEFTDLTVQGLISTACWNNTYDPATPDTVTFSGLTAGDTYEIQMIVSDGRGGSGGGIRDERWEFAFTNGDDDLVAVIGLLTHRPFNDGASPGMAGDFVIGTFVADASGTQAFSMSATRGNSFAADPVSEADRFIVGESIDIAANDPAGVPSGGQVQINAMQLRNISIADEVPLGDANCDGVVDFRDIVPFIALISGGGFKAQADIDSSGVVDFRDIVPFIAILSGAS